MTENVITWTPANWITVVLMVFLGYAIIAMLSQAAMRVTGRTA